jgi:hypothetical protein
MDAPTPPTNTSQPPSCRSFLLPLRPGQSYRWLRWHPQPQALALCIQRTECDPDSVQLPRLPPELWMMIWAYLETTHHPIYGVPAPLLVRTHECNWKGWHSIHDSEGQMAQQLPQRTYNRWKRMHRQGILLHLMDNRVQIRECVQPGARWPMKHWPSLELLEVGQKAAEVAIRHRLRPHLLPDDVLNSLVTSISQTLDDSEAWRFMATIAPELDNGLHMGVLTRHDGPCIRARYSRLTRRRLDDDSQLEQLANTPSLRPPLGLHVCEGLSPPMLRHLSAQGLCAPDNQPPPTAETAAEIIRHIFSQE